MLGDCEMVLTGGAENMSQSPHVLRNVRFGIPLGRDQVVCNVANTSCLKYCPVWTQGNPSYPLVPSLPHLLLYLLVSVTFPFCLFTRFIYFLVFPSLPILPEQSHSISRLECAGCCRRRLNLTLVFFDFVLYVFFS